MAPLTRSMKQKKMMGNTPSEISELPPELLLIIFSKLPLISLFRSARYTCKLWQSIINDPIFRDSYVSPTPSYVYALRNANSGLYYVDNSTCAVKLPGDLGDMEKYKHINSCRGLISYWSNYSRSFWICNPILDDHVELPSLTMKNASCGFGYATTSKQYKLVYFSTARRSLVAKILTMGDESWRDLAVPHKYLPSDSVYCNGTLYWALRVLRVLDKDECQYRVMSIDLSTEQYRLRHVTSRKSGMLSSVNWPIVLNETVALVVQTKTYTKIWMLVNEAEDIWDEKYRICPTPRLDGKFFHSWGVWLNQEIYGMEIIYKFEGLQRHIKRRKLLSYNINHKKFSELKLPLAEDADANADDTRLLISHMGSFVSPSKIIKMATHQPSLVAR